MNRPIYIILVLLLMGCGNEVRTTYFQDGTLFTQYEVNNDGLRDGEFTEFDKKHDTLVHGFYLNDKLDGNLRTFYDNNQPKYSVEYQHGRLMKINYCYLKDGSAIQEGSFKDGNGIIDVYSPETGKLLYKENYVNGLPHGYRYTYFAGGGFDSILIDSMEIPSYAKDNLPPFQ